MAPPDRIVRWLPIPGTHGWNLDDNESAWWHSSSKFVAFLSTQGLKLVEHRSGQFVWSTDLDGIGPRSRNDWAAAGKALQYYMNCVPYQHRNVIVHSHGLQPVLFACADGLQIRRLVSVCSPVRGDMMNVAEQARPRIGRWLHLHSSGWRDLLIRLGQLFDGHFGWRSKHPLADENQAVKGAGHSSLIEDDKFFHFWVDSNWIGFIKAPVVLETHDR